MSKTRLATILVLFTIGSALWLANWADWLGTGLIVISNFLAMTPEERNTPLRRKDFLQIPLILGAFILVVAALTHWVPESIANRYGHHPAIIIPLWAFTGWIHCHNWLRASRQPAPAIPQRQPKICEECRTNEANVFLTRIVNGKLLKFHFCESCAHASFAHREHPSQR